MTREEIIKELRCLASGEDGEDCPSEKCDNTCPYWTEIERGAALYDNRQLCRAAADLLEQDANTKSRPSPIPIEEITGTILVTPCWIEIKYGEGYTHITPDILDKDSTGYFGKLYSREGETTQYLYEKDYNRTWRCWRECPGDETVNNAKWEESQ